MEKGKIAALDQPHILKKTIGGEPAIHVRVKEQQVKKAFTVLKEYQGKLVDGEIKITASNPWQTMSEISNRLVSNGIFTDKIEIVEPTLEDVFIKLSGRRLTEDSS
jgi:ABC-2 type transport system ATP-binding protein